ncbi:MAG: hypothetical protein MJE77_13510 [Proteobacteria bacterium]|nr:hypothetical protein [Pseudomonadota bacterium]
MRSPRDPVSVLALEDNANNDGWEMVLVNKQGHLAHELAIGPGHDLLPTWRPDGAKLAYIGQSRRR